ncbi:MAG: sn-glycerol-3-phosphate ABC transporter ATP-binding protein UgpC [Rhodoferax sp.]|nr:sn-glycerol-3-phosphate ABC transporter ATP-binding protein UgpC [Rhodoferax sp.]
MRQSYREPEVPEVLLRSLSKVYPGGTQAVRGVDLEVRDGEFMVLVGPSGCGKTTTLRMVAGLEEISSGQLLIGGRDVTDTPPAKRGVAMVFQSYALYPHMTIAENMGFALKMAGKSRTEIREAVGRAAEILQLNDLLARKPKELSGGQRQRVAIGRAIVRKPDVFLFDEPLSNLDASLRTQMRVELSRLHKELGATILYVTHDQVEAMTLGNRIALFNAGKIEQVGRPLELYGRPANRFVASFLGSPTINQLAARARRDLAGRIEIELPGLGRFPIEASQLADPAAVAWVGVRPEHLSLTDQTDPSALAVQVEMVERLGDATIIYMRHDTVPATLALKLAGALDLPLRPGDWIHVRPAPSHVLLFAADGRLCTSGTAERAA